MPVLQVVNVLGMMILLSVSVHEFLKMIQIVGVLAVAGIIVAMITGVNISRTNRTYCKSGSFKKFTNNCCFVVVIHGHRRTHARFRPVILPSFIVGFS